MAAMGGEETYTDKNKTSLSNSIDGLFVAMAVPIATGEKERIIRDGKASQRSS